VSAACHNDLIKTTPFPENLPSGLHQSPAPHNHPSMCQPLKTQVGHMPAPSGGKIGTNSNNGGVGQNFKPAPTHIAADTP